MQTTKAFKASQIALMVLSTALLTPFVQAQSPANHGASGAMHGTQTAPSSMSGGMDMKTMMRVMNDKMSSMKMSGNPDIDFAMVMREHHIGAIDMAQAELKNGKEPQMGTLAKEIISAQKKEMARIDKFLATHPHPTGM